MIKYHRAFFIEPSGDLPTDYVPHRRMARVSCGTLLALRSKTVFDKTDATAEQEKNTSVSDALFHFPNAASRDPAVDAWIAKNDPMRMLVKPWIARIRALNPNIRELLHDQRPTFCLEDTAFAYVDTYSRHANIGFFFGAFLDDPSGLLEGSGIRMRHVKLHSSDRPNSADLEVLIISALKDIRQRLAKTRN